MTLDTALITAIAALAGALVFLYFDKTKADKAYAESLKAADRAHSDSMKSMGETFSVSMTEAIKTFAATTKENSDIFSKAIKEANRDHAEQEERIHAQNQKVMETMVDDHRREMAGMVDRALTATRNDKDHDRELTERVLRLTESIERRAQWKP